MVILRVGRSDAMFNTIKFGNQIAAKRREAGLTQEGLVERVGDDYISVSTLKRIESGQGHIDMLRVIRICRALGIELSELLGESNLQQTLEHWFDDPEEENEVQDRLYRQRLFYPKSTDSQYYESRPIKTLMQFLIYLPLMNDMQVLDALQSIEGNVFDRESYVLEKLRYLFDQIPDSKAKRYADYEAAKCTYDYFVEYYSSEIPAADQVLLDPDRCKEILSCHDEYVALIEKQKEKVAATGTLLKSII